jgi:hypothetical protein
MRTNMPAAGTAARYGGEMTEQELAAIINDLQHWDSASPYRKEGMADIFVERFKNHTLTLIAEVRRLQDALEEAVAVADAYELTAAFDGGVAARLRHLEEMANEKHSVAK